MTEIKSPAQIEVDNQPYNRGFHDGWELAHKPAACGHARANYKDPKFGTPEYRGQERCEFCEALAKLRRNITEVCGNMTHLNDPYEGDDVERPINVGDTWTNIFNGRVFRWDGKNWVWTGETVPVPCLGEFP